MPQALRRTGKYGNGLAQNREFAIPPSRIRVRVFSRLAKCLAQRLVAQNQPSFQS